MCLLWPRSLRLLHTRLLQITTDGIDPNVTNGPRTRFGTFSSRPRHELPHHLQPRLLRGPSAARGVDGDASAKPRDGDGGGLLRADAGSVRRRKPEARRRAQVDLLFAPPRPYPATAYIPAPARRTEPETQRSRRAFSPFSSFKVSRVMPSSETKGRDQALCLQLWAASYTFRRPTLADFARYQDLCLQLWVEGHPPRLGLI